MQSNAQHRTTTPQTVQFRTFWKGRSTYKSFLAQLLQRTRFPFFPTTTPHLGHRFCFRSFFSFVRGLSTISATFSFLSQYFECSQSITMASKPASYRMRQFASTSTVESFVQYPVKLHTPRIPELSDAQPFLIPDCLP